MSPRPTFVDRAFIAWLARAYCSRSSSRKSGSAMTSMPSSASASRFARRGPANGAFVGLALVDAARLFGETRADILGVAQHCPHLGQDGGLQGRYFQHRTHRRALRPAAAGARAQARAGARRSAEAPTGAGDRCRPADRARDQTSRLLRVVVFVRTEPAFEDVAVLALEVENFECHGVYMRITRQNTESGPRRARHIACRTH